MIVDNIPHHGGGCHKLNPHYLSAGFNSPEFSGREMVDDSYMPEFYLFLRQIKVMDDIVKAKIIVAGIILVFFLVMIAAFINF